MMADIQMYNYWRRKYEEAYMLKQRASNNIIDIQNRRRQIINEINALESERRNYIESQQGLTRASSNNSDITDCVSDVAKKLETASEGFLAIGETSESKPQNLSVVFSERDSAQKSTISQLFEGLKNINSGVASKISELDEQIRRLQTESSDGQNEERRLIYYMDEQDRMMSTAEVQMAYYK